MRLLFIMSLHLLEAVLASYTAPRFKYPVVTENRRIGQIYQAALIEGGVLNSWHGGDETNQQDLLKTLNVTVDLSKYRDGKIDQQLAASNVYIDSVVLQTLHDFPRWAAQGALLNYAPIGFESIYPDFKDTTSAAWYGVRMLFWSVVWNNEKLPDLNINSFQDLATNQLFKNRLVLTHPNDDDAVLSAFDLRSGPTICIQTRMQFVACRNFVRSWFDALLEQNPRWVCGSTTPLTAIGQANSSAAVSFTTSVGLEQPDEFNLSFPFDAQFVTWPQTAAILKMLRTKRGQNLSIL